MLPQESKPKIISSALKTVRRLHFIIVITAGILLIAGEILFLYRYFYQGLTESSLLLELKREEALEELKMPLYSQLREFSAVKQQERSIDWNALRDPFAKVPPKILPDTELSE